MVRRRKKPGEAVEMQMGPMIDIVFLLLVFFMVTAKPVDPESDLSMALPGAVSQDVAVEPPDDQRIVIRGDGGVVLNDLVLGGPGDTELGRLVATLVRFRKSAEMNRSEAMVTLAPHDEVPHQRVMDVLNACAKADLHNVSFGDADGGGGGGQP